MQRERGETSVLAGGELHPDSEVHGGRNVTSQVTRAAEDVRLREPPLVRGTEVAVRSTATQMGDKVEVIVDQV